MGNSMWIDAIEQKPVTSDNPKWSVWVLFWREGENHPFWGYYNFDSHLWVDGNVRQIYSNDEIKYFAYIDNPYK